MEYAGIRARIVAMVVDFFVLLVVLSPLVWLDTLSPAATAILALPQCALYVLYETYCHGRWGQTIGKHVAGVWVVAADGAMIGMRQAFLRSSVDAGFALLTFVATLWAVTNAPHALWENDSWMARQQALSAAEPAWYAWVTTAWNVWAWGEIVTALCNRKRRSLHDLIAGTVVIRAYLAPRSITPPPLPTTT